MGALLREESCEGLDLDASPGRFGASSVPDVREEGALSGDAGFFAQRECYGSAAQAVGIPAGSNLVGWPAKMAVDPSG